jgi:hypothetical protein
MTLAVCLRYLSFSINRISSPLFLLIPLYRLSTLFLSTFKLPQLCLADHREDQLNPWRRKSLLKKDLLAKDIRLARIKLYFLSSTLMLPRVKTFYFLLIFTFCNSSSLNNKGNRIANTILDEEKTLDSNGKADFSPTSIEATLSSENVSALLTFYSYPTFYLFFYYIPIYCL